MTKKQLVERAITKIVKRVLNEAGTTEHPDPSSLPKPVKDFYRLSKIVPKRTISVSYPYEFAIGKRYTLIVSKSGQFLLVFANGHDFIWGQNSASAAYKALVSSGDL